MLKYLNPVTNKNTTKGKTMNKTEQAQVIETVEELWAAAEAYQSWWTSPELEGKALAVRLWFNLTNGDLTKAEFGEIMVGVQKAATSGHPGRVSFATSYLNTLVTLSRI